MKKKRSFSDSYLMSLWRNAVLSEYQGCAFCGNGNYDDLECHHIVKRRKTLLRYDWRNGIPLCKYTCHGEAHTKKGEEKIRQIIGEDWDYICNYETKTLKDHLIETHQSKNEFLTSKADELKKKIMEN